MNRRKAMLMATLLAAALVALTTGHVSTSGAQSPATENARKAWAQFTQQQGGRWHATWNRKNDAVTELRGGRSTSLSGSPEQVAKEFLTQNKTLFGISSDLSDLSVENLKQSPAGSHVFLKQTYQGLPVFNGGADVHIAPGNRVFLVHSRYATQKALSSLSLRPSVPAEDASRTAEADARNYKVTDKSGRPISLGRLTAASNQLGIWRADDGCHLAYLVDLVAMKYIVDAQSGKILERTQVVSFVTGSANGTGQVFDPNPVITLNNPKLGDQNNKNYKALKKAYQSVTLMSVTGTTVKKKTTYALVGPYENDVEHDYSTGVCTSHKTPPADTVTVVKTKPNFIFTRVKNGFDDVMAYFHIDRTERYLQGLGFDDINNRSIPVDAQGITDDNSFYCPDPPGAGYLTLGTGGVDDAQDADVILHEYGHSMQDNQNSAVFSAAGKVEETSAMGEGFGDFWAITNRVKKLNNSLDQCFSPWDHNIVDYPADKGCLRRVDGKKHYPEALDGEEHDDGEIWSAALNDLYTQLGKTTIQDDVLESHFLLPAGATMKDGALALIDADDADNGGANLPTICAAMAFRGILTPQDLADNQCEMPTGDGVLGNYGLQDTFTVTCHGTFIAANVTGDFGVDIENTITGVTGLAGSQMADSFSGDFQKLEVMRNPNTQVGTAADLSVSLSIVANAPASATVNPPFNQCPAIGSDSSCEALIVADSSGKFSLNFDSSQGPFDAVEDALIGIQNNSPNPISSIALSGTDLDGDNLFGFDGDGICAVDFNGDPLYPNEPAGCPFGPTGYEGPGTSYTVTDPAGLSGIVNFSPPVPPGGSAYFSLEGVGQPPSPPIDYTAEVVCDGTNLAIAQTGDDQ